MERDLLRLFQACVGIVTLLGMAILVFGLFPSMKSEVGAAWAGAVGTIATLIGTIVLATSERRVRLRQEQKLRQLAAVKFSQYAEEGKQLLKQCAFEMRLQLVNNRAREKPVSFVAFEPMLSRFPSWTDAELVELVSPDSECAHILAAIKSALRKEIADLPKDGEIDLEKDTKPDYRFLNCIIRLKKIESDLDYVSDECRAMLSPMALALLDRRIVG